MTRHIAEQAILDALANAFKDVDHDVWNGATLNCAPTRIKEVRELQRKGVDNWTPEDIDWLFFKAATTVGSEETVKFALPRLLAHLIRDEIFGSVSEGAIAGKLDYAGFSNWPTNQRTAALNAIALLAEHCADEEYRQTVSEGLREFVARQRAN
ncbi:hypothetical protein [Vitreimonas sp.]|jgi:hypothetical protein|uniref:hypothetical protein n=1 Tax=Vitreimonas sp. TaxID=3069702 RepID=UPI002ED9CA0E